MKFRYLLPLTPLGLALAWISTVIHERSIETPRKHYLDEKLNWLSKKFEICQCRYIFTLEKLVKTDIYCKNASYPGTVSMFEGRPVKSSALQPCFRSSNNDLVIFGDKNGFETRAKSEFDIKHANGFLIFASIVTLFPYILRFAAAASNADIFD